MRVMLMIKGDPEPGAAPSEELLAAMGSYNDELKQAGVLLDLAGLLPSVAGRRVRFSGGSRAVIDGPFPESKALIAGYWILQVPSMDEAVEWAERFPFEAWSPDLPGRVRRHGRDRDPSGVRAGVLVTHPPSGVLTPVSELRIRTQRRCA
jgi:hypothetical protein